MRFEKWQALGNDYLILEHSELAFELTPARIRKLCAEHFGVFADGVLLLEPVDGSDVVAQLRIFNPDGSEAELSGNGAREAILYLRHHRWTELDVFTIRTAAGEIRPTITGPDTCRVDMGRATLRSKDYPSGGETGQGELLADGRSWGFQHVSIGNPQCAIGLADLATLQALDLPALGPSIEGHALFPNRTNVSWYTPLPNRDDRGVIRARIYERGVGETLSSGTGASGAAIAYYLAGGPARTEVVLDGGELEVEVGEDLQVHLTGWARPVFSGRLSDDFVKELHETE